ncbi:hypothetical protein MLD38_024078 [Melastoma candidum]|uniref:Uncharacterized protein n=1 Tax=Melastoma candidum TaxID=119954 RepID=A0ACB9NQZ6_9MYRT|nr:hypothetical protein MLD38_024078 [Melastoma candidum]
MVERKAMSKASPVLLVVILLGFCFALYNFLTMVMHHRAIKRWATNEKTDYLLTDPLVEMPHSLKRLKRPKARFHVALTATDAVYNKWQCRIKYYLYKRQKDLPGSEMGGFTRILHSGKPDNLMDEIPTVVVDPLPEGQDRVSCISYFECRLKALGNLYLERAHARAAIHNDNLPDAKLQDLQGHIRMNERRPWAFVQWLEKATIKGEYILMAEPDHVFVRRLPNLADDRYPASFPFSYIRPDQNEKIIGRYYPEEKGLVTNVDPSGNSSVIIKKDMLKVIAPTWMNASIKMKEDPETDKTFGWVLEMYAYSICSARGTTYSSQGLHVAALQPPWDLKTDNKFIVHYTPMDAITK